jgi:hypothetical protein
VGNVTDPFGAAVPGAKSFSLTERVKLRFDTQFFNGNHPNFVLPSMVLAGIPEKAANADWVWDDYLRTSSPTGLVDVSWAVDSTPGMIAFRLALEV